MIETKRLVVEPMTTEELKGLVEQYKGIVEELSQAYEEMLTHCLQFPEEILWYTSWKMILKETGEEIGYAGFKGFQDGNVEIGYGVNEEFEGNGYATEAVKALCDWAKEQKGVLTVQAETTVENIASKRVLEKCGFVENGETGEEGPRYTLVETK